MGFPVYHSVALCVEDGSPPPPPPLSCSTTPSSSSPPLLRPLHLLKHTAAFLQTCDETEDSGALQKAADFVKAFMLGFAVDDAIALLRLDNLYLDTFEVTDGGSRQY